MNVIMGDVGVNDGQSTVAPDVPPNGPIENKKILAESNVADGNSQQAETPEYPVGIENWTVRKQLKWLKKSSISRR